MTQHYVHLVPARLQVVEQTLGVERSARSSNGDQYSHGPTNVSARLWREPWRLSRGERFRSGPSPYRISASFRKSRVLVLKLRIKLESDFGFRIMHPCRSFGISCG